MPSSQVQPLPQGPPSLVKGSRVEGSANEVLAIALAALTFNNHCGGEDEHGHLLEDFMQAAEGFSDGYVKGATWHTPLSWTGKGKWIVAYLKGMCRVSANEVANTISVAWWPRDVRMREALCNCIGYSPSYSFMNNCILDCSVEFVVFRFVV